MADCTNDDLNAITVKVFRRGIRSFFETDLKDISLLDVAEVAADKTKKTIYAFEDVLTDERPDNMRYSPSGASGRNKIALEG